MSGVTNTPDLVERLRANAKRMREHMASYVWRSEIKMQEDAADEIERLRAEVHRLEEIASEHAHCTREAGNVE